MNVQDPSIVNRYVTEIRRYPVLTREEEVDLIREVREGRVESRDRLIQCNLRFVVKVAGWYRGLGVPLEDLINEGNLGLIEAAQRFDPSRGIRFISWAVCWIQRSIRRALSQQSHTVRLPDSQFRRMQRTRNVERDLTQELGRKPTASEIAERLGGKPTSVEAIHLHGLRMSSLDDPIGDEPCDTLSGLLEDDAQLSVEAQMMHREAGTNVRQLYEQLDDKERAVICRRFGFDGGTPQTLAQVGERIGISREGVRLIERRAILRLRRRIAAGRRRKFRPGDRLAS